MWHQDLVHVIPELQVPRSGSRDHTYSINLSLSHFFPLIFFTVFTIWWFDPNASDVLSCSMNAQTCEHLSLNMGA